MRNWSSRPSVNPPKGVLLYEVAEDGVAKEHAGRGEAEGGFSGWSGRGGLLEPSPFEERGGLSAEGIGRLVAEESPDFVGAYTPLGAEARDEVIAEALARSKVFEDGGEVALGECGGVSGEVRGIGRAEGIAVEGVCGGAKPKIGRAVPIGGVVASETVGEGEVGEFVMVVTGMEKPSAEEVKLFGSLVVAERRESLPEEAVQGGAFFDGEEISGDMGRP
jgi:hypothetical protein